MEQNLQLCKFSGVNSQRHRTVKWGCLTWKGKLLIQVNIFIVIVLKETKMWDTLWHAKIVVMSDCCNIVLKCWLKKSWNADWKILKCWLKKSWKAGWIFSHLNTNMVVIWIFVFVVKAATGNWEEMNHQQQSFSCCTTKKLILNNNDKNQNEILVRIGIAPQFKRSWISIGS